MHSCLLQYPAVFSFWESKKILRWTNESQKTGGKIFQLSVTFQMTSASYWWLWTTPKQPVVSKGVTLFSEVTGFSHLIFQSDSMHIQWHMRDFYRNSPRKKNKMLLYSFFLCTLLRWHKTLFVLWVSVIAKQISPVIMLYSSVSSVNLKIFYKGREILLFLFKVDGSHFTDLVTIPHNPLRQQ